MNGIDYDQVISIRFENIFLIYGTGEWWIQWQNNKKQIIFFRLFLKQKYHQNCTKSKSHCFCSANNNRENTSDQSINQSWNRIDFISCFNFCFNTGEFIHVFFCNTKSYRISYIYIFFSFPYFSPIHFLSQFHAQMLDRYFPRVCAGSYFYLSLYQFLSTISHYFIARLFIKPEQIDLSIPIDVLLCIFCSFISGMLYRIVQISLIIWLDKFICHECIHLYRLHGMWHLLCFIL